MRKLTSLSLLSVTLLASFGAHAADTTELKVIGTIKPAACTPTISGGGTADFGTIPVSKLSATAATLLPEKKLQLTVTCDSAAKIGLVTVDNRSATVVKGIVTRSSWGDDSNGGLGQVDGKNIGAYSVQISNPRGDNNAVNRLTDVVTPGSWSSSFGGSLFYKPGSIISFGTGETPSAFKTITADLSIIAGIAKSTDLPSLTKEIPLDGSATIELRYL